MDIEIPQDESRLDQKEFDLGADLDPEHFFLSGEKGRALFVAEDEWNLLLLKKLLEDSKLQVDTAKSVDEALFMLRRSLDRNKAHIRIALAFLPKGENRVLDLPRLLLDLEKEKRIMPSPVIAMTTMVLDENSIKLIDLGFKEYVRMPINKAMLDRVIRKYI